MKKTRIAIECCLILITSVFSLVIFDVVDKQKYDFFYEHPYEFQVNLNVVATNDSRLGHITEIAMQNSVIIMYKANETVDDLKGTITTYYLTKSQYDVQANRMKISNNAEYMSTETLPNSEKIYDFLNNDTYAYRVLDADKIAEFGTVTISAKSEADFEAFILQLVETYSEGTELVLNSSAIVTNDVLTIAVIISIVSLMILLLVDIFVSTYYFMSRSKDIGVMMLLGKPKMNIFGNLYLSSVKINLLFYFLIIVLSFVFIPNVSALYMGVLVSIYIILFVIKYAVNFVSFSFLIKKKSRQFLLKNKSFNKTAYYITKFLKTSFSLLLVIIVLITYFELKQILSIKAEYTKHTELDQWTLITSFQPDVNYLSMTYEEQLQVNNSIYTKLNDEYQVFYVQRRLSKINEKDYIIADINYLNKFGVFLNDYDSNVLIILIPESLKSAEDEVREQLRNELDRGYIIQYYEGGKFNTYEFYTDGYSVLDPVIMIYNTNSPNIYEMFGQGLNTALKIDESPEKIYNTLNQTLSELGVRQTFNQSSFVTLAQEKENRLNLSLYTLYFILVIVLIIVFTDILLIFNYSLLFLSKYKKELAVRALLGHDYFKFIDRDLYRNLIIDCFVCTVSLVIYFFLTKSIDLIVCVIVALMPIVSYIYNLVLYQTKKNDSVHNFLKGEDL